MYCDKIADTDYGTHTYDKMPVYWSKKTFSLSCACKFKNRPGSVFDGIHYSQSPLETLYAAENFGTEKLDDNAEGDTFNRYKVGVHPTEEDPNHWNPLVTEQTQEQQIF